MKRLFLTFAFLLSAVLLIPHTAVAQTVAVTGHLKSGNTTSVTTKSFVRFRLRNFSGNTPRIVGTGAIAQTQFDILPDNTGTITTNIYGNDYIVPVNTFWTVETWYNGVFQFSYNYGICATTVLSYCAAAGATFNLDTASPLSFPTPPSPYLPLPGPAGPAGPPGPSGSAGNPASPPFSFQYANSGLTAFLGAPGITTPDGNSLTIKGPDPYVDITSTGARAISAPLSTTASCVGTTTITVAANTGFVKGDGVVIYGCGATETMSTPSAPTVTPGISNTLTVPDAILTTNSAGGTSYSYKIVNRDKFGGLTLPSAVTTIATGPSTLGENQLTITSTTIAGNTMTVVMSATEGLAQNELVHLTGGTNAAAQGWFTISTITNGTTFVINNIPQYYAAGLNSTGGTLTYFTGNQITWTNSGTNIWESIICASRPADSGAYHVIGLSYPVNSVAYGSTTTYTDWGANLSTKPNLPAYIADSICSAGSATNDYLSTTITNINGTAITVANAASQTAAGQTFLFDDAPAILAAATFANSSVSGTVLIPASSAGIFYYVNSFLDLSSFTNTTVRQEGILSLNETFKPTNRWIGITSGRVPTTGITAATVGIGGGWPAVYYNDMNANPENLDFEASGNQALPMLVDGGGSQVQGAPQMRNLIFNTGFTSSDYAGIGLVIRPAAFNIRFDNISFRSGPGNGGGFADTTWTPAFYLARDTTGSSGASGTSFWEIRNIQFFARTFYRLNGTFGVIHNVYSQGPLIPTITLQTSSGLDGSSTFIDGLLANDTSGSPYLALLGTGERAANIYASGLSGLSSSGNAGVPPQITGAAPGALNGQFNASGSLGPGYGAGQSNNQPISNYTNSSIFDSLAYYANDYFDSGNFNLSRGIRQDAGPVSSASAFFIPLGIPVLSVPVASAGGTIPDGAHLYCVMAVGFNGGWGKASCQSFTVVGSNQTLAFSWTAVTGAKGYVIAQDNNNCLPTVNANCAGLTTSAGTTTLSYTGGGVNTQNIGNMTASGDGSNGFNATGHFGLQYSCPETTAPSGVVGFDILYCDSAAHRFKILNNNGATSTVAALSEVPQVYNSTGTLSTGPHTVQDTCTLGTSCSVTLTGTSVFTSSTSYTCTAQDQTAAAATRVVQSSGSAFAITGTGTDVIRYVCVGN